MNSSDRPITPMRVPEDFLIAKTTYFLDVHLWPRETKLNTDGWMTNFQPAERDHAVHLLNAFLYYSTDLVDELFKAAFQNLSSTIVPIDGPYVVSQAVWKQFCANLIVTHVTGEDPNNTDSGYIFARKVRQLLGIPEDNIMAPDAALIRLADEGPYPVLFVDDFVGSGHQFIATWHRSVDHPDGTVLSFGKYAQVSGAAFYYCPLFCSSLGFAAIQRDCSRVVLSPAHELSEKYSVLSPESFVWPDHLRQSAPDFLEAVSKRAGIVNWLGYMDQGLTIAFEHGVPDATLPLFYHNENGWIPLIKRT